jgi:hypothetical protein
VVDNLFKLLSVCLLVAFLSLLLCIWVKQLLIFYWAAHVTVSNICQSVPWKYNSGYLALSSYRLFCGPVDIVNLRNSWKVAHIFYDFNQIWTFVTGSVTILYPTAPHWRWVDNMKAGGWVDMTKHIVAFCDLCKHM